MSDFNFEAKESNFLFKLTSPETIAFDDFFFCDIEGGAEYLGNTYQYLPHINVKGLSYSASGVTATPYVTIGDNGIIGIWVNSFNSFLGFQLELKRIKAINLANANPIYQTPFDMFKISKKSNHIPGHSVTFKLRRPATLNNKIPGRLINATCSWKTYRGAGCSYQGSLMFDANNVQTQDPNQDICALNLDACQLRNNVENFSGVPTIDDF